jgi:hypothetical protein
MLNVWEYFDPYLLVLYKITGVAGLDGLIGTFLVALLANVIGEFTISIAFRVNRGHLDRLNRPATRRSTNRPTTLMAKCSSTVSDCPPLPFGPRFSPWTGSKGILGQAESLFLSILPA